MAVYNFIAQIHNEIYLIVTFECKVEAQRVVYCPAFSEQSKFDISRWANFELDWLSMQSAVVSFWKVRQAKSCWSSNRHPLISEWKHIFQNLWSYFCQCIIKAKLGISRILLTHLTLVLKHCSSMALRISQSWLFCCLIQDQYWKKSWRKNVCMVTLDLVCPAITVPISSILFSNIISCRIFPTGNIFPMRSSQKLWLWKSACPFMWCIPLSTCGE